MKRMLFIICFVLLALPHSGVAAPALVADDRVKTFVFDSSEIYRVNTRGGFQTTIEFNADEVIDTLSIGDSIGWQLTPSGRRLFVKPLYKSGITNLSVITNRRTYQFELVSTSSDSMTSSHVYVVRFYYPEQANNAYMPDDRTRGAMRPVSPTDIPDFAGQMYQNPASQMQAPLPRMYNPLPGSYR